VQLSRSFARYDERQAKFSTWPHRIALKVAISQARRQRWSEAGRFEASQPRHLETVAGGESIVIAGPDGRLNELCRLITSSIRSPCVGGGRHPALRAGVTAGLPSGDAKDISMATFRRGTFQQPKGGQAGIHVVVAKNPIVDKLCCVGAIPDFAGMTVKRGLQRARGSIAHTPACAPLR
jgi:hypothetical protein